MDSGLFAKVFSSPEVIVVSLALILWAVWQSKRQSPELAKLESGV